MIINSSAWPATDTLEAIQVQLAAEALKFALIKVIGHHLFQKGFRVMNLKGGSIIDPRDDVIKALFLGLLEKKVEFLWKDVFTSTR